jgi:hypothetical protein
LRTPAEHPVTNYFTFGKDASAFANFVLRGRGAALDALIGSYHTPADTRMRPELILPNPRNKVCFHREENAIEGITG